MYKYINDQIRSIFSDLIKKFDHKYPTNFSQSSFQLKSILWIVQNTLSIRGPNSWNGFISKGKKDTQSFKIFQKKIKSKLIKIENETDYFWWNIHKVKINDDFRFSRLVKTIEFQLGLDYKAKSFFQVPFPKL